MRAACVFSLALVAVGCDRSPVQNGQSAPESTVGVLINASVPLVTANVRRGNLNADSLLVLEEGTRFSGYGVELLLVAGTDTTRVRASQGEMRLGSGAVELAGLQFRSRAGLQIAADSGKFDGRGSLQFTKGLRVNGRSIEPPLDGVAYRLDSGELTGCGRRCA